MVLDESPQPQYVVFTPVFSNGFEQVDQMVRWCMDNCEGSWSHNYYSWHRHKWWFTSKQDSVQFALAWCHDP